MATAFFSWFLGGTVHGVNQTIEDYQDLRPLTRELEAANVITMRLGGILMLVLRCLSVVLNAPFSII